MSGTHRVEPDILVVGAGPVGGPLALGLQQQGYSVVLVEKHLKPLPVFKGEYLQSAASQVLKRLGLTKVFEQPSCQAVKELRFRDLNDNQDITSEILMSYPSQFAATAISHLELIRSIREHVTENLCANAHFGAQLTALNSSASDFFCRPQFQITKADGAKLEVGPKWIVGCDGRASTVRKWMIGAKLPQNAPVTWGTKAELIVGSEIATPPPNPHRYEVFRFSSTGTLSSFSLGDLGQRLYLSHPDGHLTGVKSCRRTIAQMLNELNGICELGQLEEKAPILSFPAYGQWFGPVANGAFLLAGDAANVTSPYGGQGLSAGLEHVEYLIDNFDFSLRQNEISQEQAAHYAIEVKRVYERISLLNFGLYYLFFARAPIFKRVSAHILNGWEAQPELKERVIRLFAGLDRDKPSASELLQLWGLTWSPRRLSWPQARLSLRSLGELWENRF